MATIRRRDLSGRDDSGGGDEHGISKRRADRIVKALFAQITAHIARGDRIELRGFGVLSVRRRRPRVAHNPRTGEKVNVPAKHVVKLKPGRLMNDALNGSP
ncbi:MAG: integration host factor subunit beta [Phycisphaera sp.]|nr:integration host factor subunit beta [Phycisphaera sp.]